MQVKGDLESLQTSIDFYLGIVNNRRCSARELRKHYIDEFIGQSVSDWQRTIRVNSVAEVVKVKNEENVVSTTKDIHGNNTQIQSEVGGIILEDLAVRVIPHKQEQGIVEEAKQVISEPKKEISGTLLEDLPIRTESKKPVSGTFLEDLPIRIEPQKPVSGTFLEELSDRVVTETPKVVDSSEDVSDDETWGGDEESWDEEEQYEEDEDSWEDGDSSEDETQVDVGVEGYREDGVLQEVHRPSNVVINVGGTVEVITEDDDESFLFGESTNTVEHVQPSNIIDMSTGKTVDAPIQPQAFYADVRSFVKKNNGCSMEEALKFFPKKDIDKAIKGMKIYNKRGKLFV